MKNKYQIVRIENAGVFAGEVTEYDRETRTAIVINARRLWYWDGAATLSQLAMEGTKKPNACKFPCEVEEITLPQVIELIPCTDQARESIKNVSVWEK